MRFFSALLALTAAVFLNSCGPLANNSGSYGKANMGGPSIEARVAQIKTEPRGDFYYGRRYYVKKTRFWGYVRKPGQMATESKLVIFNESRERAPDRFSENGLGNQRYGFDNNYEYKLRGFYSGRTLYEPNSNQFLPEFTLTGYELVNRNPGWLFSPKDHFNPVAITLTP